jgi:hypothetical protein
MASKAMIGRSGTKGAKAKNSVAPASYPDGTGGKGVKVSAKGGAGRIGPDHCTSKRGAPNVTSGAYGHD